MEVTENCHKDNNDTMKPHPNLNPIIVGGQNVTSMRALFDHENNILVASNRQLIYYSLETCEEVSHANISPTKLKSDESVVACEKMDIYLYLFTNYGSIFIWNLETKDWNNELQLPVSENETLVTCKMLSKRQYIYSLKDDTTNEINLYYSMSRSERERPKQRELIGECSIGCLNTIDIGCVTSKIDLEDMSKTAREKASKQRLITFIKDSRVYFQQIGIGEKLHVQPNKQRIDEHKFTCVRANHVNPMVAAGDDLGRIYLYTGDLIEGKPNRTKLHWHSLPVNDLCFSSTGGTLFSVGGESGCLVEWDLARNSIGNKSVKPRLGMPIRHINCSDSLNQLVLSFEDNEIQFIDTSRDYKKLRTFTRRTIDLYQQNDIKALRVNEVQDERNFKKSNIGLLWHSKTDSIVANSKPGRLQFFSPKSRTRLQSLNFLKSNILTLERDSQVVPSDIARATLSIDGNWLAFYETREQEGLFPDVKLHIWQRSATNGNWGWIQTADRLHSSPVIADLKFSPDGQFLISVSEDGTFQILHRVCLDVKTSSKQMYAKGFVSNVPNKLPAMAAFSQDSSVMALSLKNDTTLIWMIVDAYKLVYEYQLNQIVAPPNSESSSEDNPTRPENHEVLGLHFRHHEPTQSIAPLCEVRTNAVRIWNILNPLETAEYLATENSQSLDKSECSFTSAAFDLNPDGSEKNLDYFAVSTENNLIYMFKLQIDPGSRKLMPLIVIDASHPTLNPNINPYYTDMCFLADPIVEIDQQCHQDPHLVRLVSRLCLLNNYQELVSITDKLTLERESASNNCNEMHTVDKNDLQNYFSRNIISYSDAVQNSQTMEHSSQHKITEKQRRIRNRIQVQKMLKELLIRIPSQNLPSMEILGPMILDKLI